MSQPILTRLLRGHHRPPLTSLLLLTTPSPTKTNTKLILQASFSSSTSRLTFDPDSYLAQARQTFAARQPTHIIPDTLSPTNSYLLTLSLADQIPSLFPWYHHHHHQPSSSPIHYPGTTTTQQKEGEDAQEEDEDPLTLPQGHHLVYFPLQLAPSKLMPDGTDPAHCPGPPFTRRLWAGGSVVFKPGWREVLRMDGRRVCCVENVDVKSVKYAEGKGDGDGGKVFVDVRRRYGLPGLKGGAEDGEGAAAVVEEVRRLVFLREERGEMGVGRVLKARHPPDYTHRLLPTATLLFHFSALTYNAHQIHLNPLYAQKCEGYKDLLVHGPLTLVLMISALRAALAGARLAAGPGGKKGTPYVVSLTYRNLAPLYVDEPLTVCLRRRRGVASSSGTAGDETEGLVVWDVWIEGPLGGMAVKGEAVTTG